MNRLISAELLKLRTVRSLPLTLVAALALLLFVTRQMLSGAGTGAAPALGSEAQLHQLFAAPGMLGILLLLFGALAATADVRYRTVVGDFLAVPRRWPVVAAKAAAVFAVAVIWAILAGAAQLALTVPAMSAHDVDLFAAMTPRLWTHAATALALGPLMAVLGVGLGTVVRNQALAAGGGVLWFAFLEHELAAMAPSLGKWLPATASLAMGGMGRIAPLSPATGAVLLSAWALALALAGALLTIRRDV